jgi:hypothetical protein
VIITNCDVALEAQISKIEKEITNMGIEPVRVCSVSRKTRGGDKKEQFGKEPALKKILTTSYEKVGKELSIVVYKQAIDFFRKFKEEFVNKIDNSDISIFKMDDMDNSLDNILGELDGILDGINDINDFVPPAYISYYNFIENFDIEYQGRNVLEESFDEISNFTDNFDIDNFGLVRRINEATENMEDGNVFEKIGAVITVAGTALFLKSTIKKAINEIFGEYTSKLYSQLWKIERS